MEQSCLEESAKKHTIKTINIGAEIASNMPYLTLTCTVQVTFSKHLENIPSINSTDQNIFFCVSKEAEFNGYSSKGRLFTVTEGHRSFACEIP